MESDWKCKEYEKAAEEGKKEDKRKHKNFEKGGEK
jgi:hypothetical protein